MGLSCGVSTLKYILFVFNVLCTLLSAVIVAIATVAIIEANDVQQLTPGSESAPIVLLCIGIVSLLIAFFGCCGAIRQSTCLLNTYAALLMVLLLCKIAIGAVVLVQMDSVLIQVHTQLDGLWQRRETESVFWNSTQSGLECCGLNAPSDWMPLISVERNLPAACCPPNQAELCTPATAFPRGCLPVISDIVTLFGNLIAYIALGVAGVELIGFVFSCILVNGIRNAARRARY